jgi:hypothetical protein
LRRTAAADFQYVCGAPFNLDHTPWIATILLWYSLSVPQPPLALQPTSSLNPQPPGKSALQDSIATSAAIDDGSDAEKGGHLFLQTRNSVMLAPKWKWTFCRVADAARRQQQQQQQHLQLNLLVFDSIESSCDSSSQPLHSIPLASCRCYPQLLKASGHALQNKKIPVS